MPCPTPWEICPGRPRSTENVGPRNDHNEMGVIPRDNSLLRTSHLPSNRRVAMKQLEAFQEYRQALGITGVSLDVNPGGQIPYDRVVHSIRLLTEKVIPKFY